MEARRIDINWNPELSIYASEKFLRLVGDEYGWLGGFGKSGDLRCVLPYTIVTRGHVFRMVRFRVEPIPLQCELSVDEERAFINNASEYFRAAGSDMIIPATTNTIFRAYPNGATAAPYGSYTIDLKQSEDVIWSNIKKSNRNRIKGAVKRGVEIREGVEYLDAAYGLVRDTFKRSKMPFMDYQEFGRLVNGLGESVKIFVAYYKGRAQGCSVMPFSQYSTYALYGGRLPDAEPGAMNLLKWETIKFFRELGVRIFDFVGVRINPEKGSKQAGIESFKESFGGNLVRGYMWKIGFNPLKFAVYNLAVRVLRGGDIVDSEHHKLDGVVQ